MNPPKTNFEQIPIETVKEIAQEFPEKNVSDSGSKSIETQSQVRSSGESWREVAEKVQHERDSRKINELAKELVALLDQEVKLRRG